MTLFSRKQEPSAQTRQEPRVQSKKKSGFLNGFRRMASEIEPVDALKERYKPYKPPTGVMGGEGWLAQDEAPSSVVSGLNSWTIAQIGAYRSWLADGLGFMGYPYLAEMAQRAEFRKPCDVIAREATREWIQIRVNNGDDERDKKETAQKIEEIEAEFKRLNVRRILQRQIHHGLIYGLGHIWIDIAGTGTGVNDQNRPLPLTPQSIQKGSLERLRNIEPVWTTPNTYNADNPFKENYYRPDNWWVQGCLVHRDRLMTMVPYEVSDLFKPAFNFGGLSLTQQLRPYVHNYLRTRNSVSNITANFSKLVLKTDMTGNMQTGDGMDYGDINPASLQGRAQIMQVISEGQDTIIADKEMEDVSIIATPLSGLDALQAQSMEAMASIPGIPLVKLFGIQPTGLNASSEGEIRVFYDEIAAFQEAHMRPTLERILKLVQLNLWGEIDPAIDFDFSPLWQMDDEKAAVIEKAKADADALNIQMGKITPEEARQREERSDTSLYRNVDLRGPPPEQPDDDMDEMPDLMGKAKRGETDLSYEA